MKGVGFFRDFRFLFDNFGLSTALSIRFYPVVKSLFRNNYAENYRNAVLDFLKKKTKCIVTVYKNKEKDYLKTNISDNDYIIWVCWWQGEELMPDIVKICYQSILKNADNKKVVLITKSNYRDYINLSSRIEKLVNEEVISITHLSDLLRIKLLRKYGGLWIDSTYWVTATLNFEKYTFFTLKQKPLNMCTSISQMRWSGNFLATHSDSFIMNFLDDALMEYWERSNSLLDYFLLDYLIEIAYEEFPSIRKEIDRVPYTGDNPHWLNYHFNEIFNENTFRKQIISNPYAKLSWKKNYNEYENGKLTYYGYFKKVSITL